MKQPILTILCSGCYIRAYQHVNKEGYSSVCDKSYGCNVVNGRNGPLTENQGSSVYCFCESKSKFIILHEVPNLRYLLNVYLLIIRLRTASLWYDLLERY